MPVQATRSILLAGCPDELGKSIESILAPAGFQIQHIKSAAAFQEVLAGDLPQCIIAPHYPGDEALHQLLWSLKEESILRCVPLVLVINPDDLPLIDWHTLPADDYFFMPFSEITLRSRINLCLVRSQRDISANPLSGLPGNIGIIRETSRRLGAGRPFAAGYVDIDHFKAYNDRYGFSRGDEVLRMTARMLVNVLRGLGCGETYAGHVGGDDFVFFVPSSHAELAGKSITSNFDAIIPGFYDEEDRLAGKICSLDRQGNPQEFPLMSLSIAIIDTSISSVTSLGEISSRAAELKKKAKSMPGSNYVIDRRK